MSYIDLSTLHTPTPASEPPATWGQQIRDNFEFFHDNRRVICTSSTRPASPFEGLEIYETDTNKVLIYDGSAWVTTAYLGALDSFTPTLTQSATVTKTVTEATYKKIGRWVEGHVILAVTSAGTVGNGIQMGVPFGIAATGNTTIGVAWIFDASTSTGYSGPILGGSGGTVATCWAHLEANNVGQDPSFALASGDQVSYRFGYRTAS